LKNDLEYMTNIYVPIRAYGDFTITTAVVKNHFEQKLPVILPGYMKTLYNALNAGDYYDIVDEINLEKSPIFFELHKIKSLEGGVRLIKETALINSHLNRKENYLFDYDSSRINIFFRQFSYPARHLNIYEAKIALLEKYLPKREVPLSSPQVNFSAVKKAIFFPGSRKRSKVIADTLIKAILSSGMFSDIKLSYHSSENPPEGAIVFDNSEELKNIMLAHDFILSADSLPLHMAYYFNIPHFCIYNDLLNKQWLTPYMEENDYYTLYSGDANTALKEIKTKLAG
jgi:hypothetical protein